MNYVFTICAQTGRKKRKWKTYFLFLMFGTLIFFLLTLWSSVDKSMRSYFDCRLFSTLPTYFVLLKIFVCTSNRSFRVL